MPVQEVEVAGSTNLLVRLQMRVSVAWPRAVFTCVVAGGAAAMLECEGQDCRRGRVPGSTADGGPAYCPTLIVAAAVYAEELACPAGSGAFSGDAVKGSGLSESKEQRESP